MTAHKDFGDSETPERDFHKVIVMITHDPHVASYPQVTRYLEKGMLLHPA